MDLYIRQTFKSTHLHAILLHYTDKKSHFYFRICWSTAINTDFAVSGEGSGSERQIESAKWAIFGAAKFEKLCGSDKILGLFHLTNLT